MHKVAQKGVGALGARRLGEGGVRGLRGARLGLPPKASDPGRYRLLLPKVSNKGEEEEED